MSDVLSDAQMYLSEPDETVLTAALRNKDDIPILMDIVGEDDDEVPVISVSQETHLKNSLAHEEQDVALSDTAETSAEAITDVVEPLEATLKEAFAEESSSDSWARHQMNTVSSRYQKKRLHIQINHWSP